METTRPASEKSDPGKDELACLVQQRREVGDRDRAIVMATWDLLAKYVMPSKATFIDGGNQGYQRERAILDSTAPNALVLFASSLHGTMNDPTKMWFNISLGNEEWMDINGNDTRPAALKAWAYAAEHIAMNALTFGSANLYLALHEVYLDLGLLGTTALFMDHDPNDMDNIRSYYVHVRDLTIDEGEDGHVDFVIRSIKDMTPRKMRQRWKNAFLGRKVEGMLKSPREMSTRMELLHCVFPATDEDMVAAIPSALKPRRKWAYYSAWINPHDHTTVAVGGYDTMPYMVPRWMKAGNFVYGRSPAMTVMGDIMMVNKMAETVLRGAEKIVDPPLVLPAGGLLSPVRMAPGGLTFTDGDVKPQPLIPPGASRIELGEALIERRQDAIRQGFFLPLFATPASPVKTATQVLQEVDERQRALSPMMFRLQGELFDPLLKRTLTHLNTTKRLPKLPDGFTIKDLRFKYVNPITSAVRQQEALSLTRAFEMMQPWASVDSGAFDWARVDNISKIILGASGCPTTAISTQSQVDSLRKQRAQQQAAETMANALPAAATAQAALQTAGAAQTKAAAAAAKAGV